MQDLIKNPLFKIIGIIVILYLALFKDDSNPENLCNRLSGEKIKSNISEMTDKGYEIREKLQEAQKIKQEQVLQNQKGENE